MSHTIEGENGTYTPSAYHIAQLGKNYKAGEMVIFLEAEDNDK